MPDASAPPIRVIVAVPEPILRQGLLACLSNTSELAVVGDATNGSETLELIARHPADVAILSARIQRPGFEDLCNELQGLSSECSSLLLVLEERRETVLTAARAGIRGLVSMESSPDQIVEAIREVYSGQLRYSDMAVRYIVEDYARIDRTMLPPRTLPPADGLHERVAVYNGDAREQRLSKREKQVLALVAAGLTSREIAEELDISARTVEAHRARISDKLGIRTVAGLTRYALKMGLTSGTK
jgi:DNA-binding NarL/FixJ family response regulator